MPSTEITSTCRADGVAPFPLATAQGAGKAARQSRRSATHADLPGHSWRTMELSRRMGTATSETDVLSRGKPGAARWATSIEVLAVFAGILAYISRWQPYHP